MRICLISREYRPVSSYSGGIGTQYATLAAGLAAQGHETHVIATAPGRASQREHAGVKLTLLSEAVLRRAGLFGCLTNGQLRRLGRFDVIFTPEWGADAWRYSLRKRRDPLIVNLETSTRQLGELLEEGRGSGAPKPGVIVQRTLERLQARRADAIFSCSHAALNWTRELWGLTSPCEILPNCIDIQRVRGLAAGAPPNGFPRGHPVVAFSGRLEGRKGVHDLVPAMLTVWRELPDARLVLIGHEGKWRGQAMSDFLRAQAGPYADNLHILGDQPPERLFPAIHAADVTVFPSRWEAFGLVALEAMALGSTVVATSGSGFAEFIRDEHNGLLTPPGKPDALGRALLRLLLDRDLAGRVAANAHHDAELYGVRPVSERFVQLCQRVLR